MATLIMNPPALTDSGLFKQFSCEHFNQLKDIGESQHIQLESTVAELAKCVREAKLQDLIGVCRIHNHFHLNPDEVVQSSLGTSVDDSTIKVEQDALVLHIAPKKVAEQPEAPIPYMWAYEKESKSFSPVQFFDGTNKRMKERLNRICEQPDALVSFLKKFIEHVETTGTDKDLGVYLRYEDLIQLNKENGYCLLEDTDVAGRKQWMVPQTKEKLDELARINQEIHSDYKMTRTHWNFDELDTDSAWCGGHGACRHCSHNPT